MSGQEYTNGYEDGRASRFEELEGMYYRQGLAFAQLRKAAKNCIERPMPQHWEALRKILEAE